MSIFTPSHPRDEQGNELRRRKSDQMPFSIIAKDMSIVGDLETEGVVRIEGRIRGTVRAASQVLVGQGAQVEGDLHTREAVIGGEVVGSWDPSTPSNGSSSSRPHRSPETFIPPGSRSWRGAR
jgi:hypothetical protein